MKRTAFITGASSGIGQSTARLMAENGYRVILNARRAERLQSLADELNGRKPDSALVLTFDVRDKIAVDSAISGLEAEWRNIDILINNAGLAAGLDSFEEADMDDWERMIDTNVKGLLYTSKAIIPLLKSSPNPLIINIGSIAGKEVYPRGNVYSGTKHFVDAITKAMRTDLLPLGIKVSQVAPGAVETEFSEVRFHGDTEKASQVYKGFQPLGPGDVADAILYIAELPEHVCVNDLVLMPAAQANAVTIRRS